jgi:hypothetical protein
MTNNTLDISLRGMPRAQSRAANFVARIGDISVAQCANRRDADPLMWNHVRQDAEGASTGGGCVKRLSDGHGENAESSRLVKEKESREKQRALIIQRSTQR